LNRGISSGKYNPPSGATPEVRTSRKLTEGELPLVLEYNIFIQ
jgi:hypothetical protein